MDNIFVEAEGTDDAMPAMARSIVGASPAVTQVKNWAEDNRVVQRLKNELVPLVNEVKQRKAALNEQWRSLTKVWTLEHENPGYEGDSRLYMPAGYRGVETMVAHLTSVTFPSPAPFGVKARMEGLPEQLVEDVRMLQAYRLKQARLRLKAEAFYRQLLIKGTSVAKVRYQHKKYTKKRRARGTFEPEQYTESCTGPVFEPFDATNYYVYPEDASDKDDILVEFEELTVSAGHLRRRANEGHYVLEAVEASIGALSSEKNLATQSNLEGQGMTPPHNIAAQELVDIQEVYLDFDPKAESAADEEECVPFLVTLSSSGEVLRAIENPAWDRQSPYLVARIGAMVGRFWGQGPMHGVRQLNRLLNDQTNQAVDCTTYAINPILLINQNLVDGVLKDIEPGVPWYVQDVNQAVKFQVPPMEPVNVGSVVMAQTTGWIQEYLGAPPVLSGGSAPGRAFRSATGVNTAQTNAQVPLANIVAHCEEAVWTPMLEKFWSLDQQMTPDEVLVPLTGNPGFRRISPSQMPGDYLFEWEAASHFEKTQLRASQLTQALTTLTAPPTMMALQAQGKTVNPEPIIRQLMGDVFGIKNVDEIIAPAPMPMPGAAPGAAPGAPGAGGPSPAAEAGNPLAGESEMLGGNDEFAQVRTDANDMAAMMGGLAGGGMPEGGGGL